MTLREVKEKIGLNDEYEEYAIHDYELPFTVDEYTFHWRTQSTMGNGIGITRRITIGHSLLLTHFRIEELSEHQEDIIIHSDCEIYDVARYYIEETVL